MIFYIYGQDTFRSRDYLRRAVEQFKKQRDPQGYNVIWLDAKREAANRIFAELAAAPFLAEKRLVILENILSSLDKDLLARVAEAVADKKISDSAVAVFYQNEAGGKGKEVKRLHGILAEEKYAHEFKQLSPAEASAWAKRGFDKNGAKIGASALDYLCLNTAGDSWLLNSLVNQLSAYRGGDDIGLADVKLFLDEKAEDNIFAMADAVVAGNVKIAYKLMRDQLRVGEDTQYIFAMILRQFRILLQIRDCLERRGNMTSDAMAKEMGLHPFVIKKSLAVAKKYTLAVLRQGYDGLLQIDIRAKTGRGDQGQMIDLFVARVR